MAPKYIPFSACTFTAQVWNQYFSRESCFLLEAKIGALSMLIAIRVALFLDYFND